MKRPDDALNADRMNVEDGGKQPFMRDTVWHGHTQKMVTDEGVQKGMRTVLEERGINTRGLNADKLRQILQQYQVHMHVGTCMHHTMLCISFFCYRISMTRLQFSRMRWRDEAMCACTYLNFTAS